MKKLLLSTLLCSVLIISANAQSFHLGIKAGGNLTKIQGQSFDDGFKLSYQAGAFAEIDFSKTLGVQPELLFSQTQTKTTNFNGNIAFNTEAKLNYLSIPLLLRINAGKLLTFHVGPQYSILLNSDNTLLANGKEAFKSGDFSMIGGLQLNLKSLRVYGRYNVGLSNINDIDNKETWKSQQIQLGVGVKII